MAFDVSPNIRMFFEARGLADQKYLPMMKAFQMYCRSAYADHFFRVEDSKTIELTISRMDEKRLEWLWSLYIADLRKVLDLRGDTHGKDRGAEF